MRNRLALGLASGLLAAAMLPGIASAIGPAFGGCPRGGGWVLTPVFLYQAGDNGDLGDDNGDAWSCRKPNPGRGGFTWKQDTNPRSPI